MTTRMYVINTLSNMHVGSGEVNYGVIDNLIQRDSVTNLQYQLFRFERSYTRIFQGE